MKNKPLSFQLWLMISLLILGILLSIFGVLNLSVRDFFEKQTFDTIEFSQVKRLKNTETQSSNALDDLLDSYETTTSQSAIEYERSVNHLFLTKRKLDNPQTLSVRNFPLIKTVKDIILQQEETTKRYVFKSDQQIYAVVTKVNIREQEVYLISYMHETYTKGLIEQMNLLIMIILILSLLFSSVIARLIAKRITKPLKSLEHQFAHIAKKEWQDDLDFKRADEIGSLAKSADLMQSTLQAKDVEERDFIQTVSHDLKTPIMVIRSYSQAVLDGVISSEDIPTSIQLIDNEANKMNDKIQDLLYLYTLRNQQKAFEEVSCVKSTDYLDAIIKRFQYSNDRISFVSHIEPLLLSINEKTFAVALENIIENALRFSATTIEVTCKKVDAKIQLGIYNDGSSLDDTEGIFKRYATETQGNTGLGMAITKEIIENHRGSIKAINENDGVTFIIELNH